MTDSADHKTTARAAAGSVWSDAQVGDLVQRMRLSAERRGRIEGASVATVVCIAGLLLMEALR